MQLPVLSAPTLTHTTIDWIILAVFALLITFDAMRSGSGRAAVIAVAFPLSVFAYELIPHTFFLGNFANALSTPVLQAGLFILTFGIFFLLLHRMVYNLGAFSGGFALALLSGISATVAAIAMWIQEPALQNIWHFGPLVETVFGGSYTLGWMLLAYIILAFTRS